jgi:uncharacterized protein
MKNLKVGNRVILKNIKTASGFTERLLGLMFKKSLHQAGGLFIPECKSIHTCFMKFPLDIVFVDKNYIAIKIFKNLKPWKITPIVFKAFGVFEFESGIVEKEKISQGDKLILETD